MTSPSSPARFVHSKEDAARVFGGFRAMYWTMAVALLVASVWNPRLLAAAVVFVVVLVLWQWQIRRSASSGREWVLEVHADRLTVDAPGSTKEVRRADASFVRFVRRRIRYGAWTELQVIGPSGKPILREGIRDDHREGIGSALRARDWVVQER